MIETIPESPYSYFFYTPELFQSQKNKLMGLNCLKKESEEILSLPNFPIFGSTEVDFMTSALDDFEETEFSDTSSCDEATEEETKEGPKKGLGKENKIMRSKYLKDIIIAGHARYKTLCRSLRKRIGPNIPVHVPLFIDKNTLSCKENTSGFVELDSSGFGLATCSIQTTYSTPNFNSARFLYDQLSVFTPVFVRFALKNNLSFEHLLFYSSP
jgi:hypothetical protein